MAGAWWRIDGQHPDQWTWEALQTGRHRFDPASGRFRMRYAANHPVAAACERFPGRHLTIADGDLHLVELTVDAPALHLTHQGNLEALGLDDRIDTGRIDPPGQGGDPLLAVCQRLADGVYDWWEGVPPALVYRTRAIPSARSLASHVATAFEAVQSRPLQDAHQLIAALVARHGFVVPPPRLERGWQ